MREPMVGGFLVGGFLVGGAYPGRVVALGRRAVAMYDAAGSYRIGGDCTD